MMSSDFTHIIDFTLNGDKGSPDAIVRMRVKWGAPQLITTFNIGHRVDRDKWISKASRAKNNTTHGPKRVPASKINREISRFEQVIAEVFCQFERGGKSPSSQELRIAFNIAIGKITPQQVAKTHDIISSLRRFRAEAGALNGWSASTAKKFVTLENHLVKSNPRISFEALNTNGLVKYVDFLRNSIMLRNSSLAKELGFLRWFLRWATDQGHNTERAFERFRPNIKSAPISVVYLEWEELMAVYNYDFESNFHLAKIRDVFCFCCFTSLRYSDVANLRRSSVFGTHISIVSQKTSDPLKIELNNYSRAILDRYSSESYSSNLALPIISNQKMNDALKEIGEICELNKPITKTHYIGSQRIDEVKPKYMYLSTHVARRTFICNALMLGITPQVIMKWTGHNDYKAMKPYIDIADSAKASAMSLFNR